MSQIPFSAYNPPPGGGRRNTAPPVRPGPGITESLGVYGLEAAGPTPTRNQVLIGQLSQALGVTGQFARQLGYLTKEEIAQRNAEADKAEAQYAGQAAQDAAMRLPELLKAERLEEFANAVPDGVPVADYVNQWLTEQFAGVDQNGQRIIPTAYAHKYREIVGPRLTAAIVGVNEQRRKQARGDVITTGEQSIATARFTEVMVEYADQTATLLKLSPVERSQLFIPALELAAETGDQAQFERIAAALGDEFPALQARLKHRLAGQIAARSRQEESRLWDDAQNTVAGFLRSTTPNHEAALKTIEAMGDLDDAQRLELEERVRRDQTRRENAAAAETLDTFKNSIAALHVEQQPAETIVSGILEWRGLVPDTAIDTALRDTRLKLDEQARRQFIDEATNLAVLDVHQMMSEGDSTLGAAAVQDIVIQPPVGDPVALDADDIVDMARAREWKEIDAQFPVETAEQFQANYRANLTARLDFIRRNPEVKDPRLTQLFAGSHARLPADATADTVPPALRMAFDTWTTAGTTHAAARDLHLSSADLEFFRLAEFIHEKLPGYSPAQAMAAASNAMRSDPASVELARAASTEARYIREQVNTMAGGWKWSTQARNGNYVHAELAARARAYILATQVSDFTAINRAAEDFRKDHTLLNGYWVPTQGIGIAAGNAANLDGAARAIVDAYVEGREGADPADFTIRPDRNGELWRVTFLDSSIPAEDSPVYTSTDLAIIIDAVTQKGAFAAAQERYAAQVDRRQKLQARAYAHMKQVNHEISTKYSRWLGDNIALFQADTVVTTPPGPMAPTLEIPPRLQHVIDRIRDRTSEDSAARRERMMRESFELWQTEYGALK